MIFKVFPIKEKTAELIIATIVLVILFAPIIVLGAYLNCGRDQRRQTAFRRIESNLKKTEVNRRKVEERRTRPE